MLKTKPDPRVIFLLVMTFSTFGLLIREDVVAMAGLFVIVLVFAGLLGVQLRRIFGRIKRLMQILLLVTLLRSFFTPSGIVLFAIADVPILTTGGIAMGVLVALRLIIFIIGAAMLTVYPARALIQAMVQMKMPYEMAYMVSIGLRFVPQFAQEMQDSLIALQLRGVEIKKLKLRKRLSLYSYLLLPTLVSSLQQAKELAMSMEMRGFRALPSRTSYFSLSIKAKDYAMMVWVLALATAISFTIFNNNFYEIIMTTIYTA
ncbi:MAG: energy-coupling factor transporter transmembrane protein EcfT [Defluviitaleaceae bacterium]|nr:energy-coupling factor transporter transmembrane protein EcfT [Defluviitaleaceae bacterium]